MITGQTTSNTYQGDGSNRVWNISFDFTDSSQIKFKVNGEEVTTNFALNTVAKTLTYPTVASELDPLTSADEIVIYRDTNISQNIDFTNGGPLNAEMIEDGLDKLTMIAQEIKKVAEDKPKYVRKLADGTDIDGLKEEGEYFIENAVCTKGFPDDLKTTKESVNDYISGTGICAYVKVIPTETNSIGGYPTTKVTQICFFYTRVSIPDNIANFSGAYIRTYNDGSDYPPSWSQYFTNLINRKRIVYCGTNFNSTPFIPTKFYPNTTYVLSTKFSSLTLNNLPNSPYPVEFIFYTDSSFSGITASQITDWIGNTTLDANSKYKITISNLIGTIEKVTV